MDIDETGGFVTSSSSSSSNSSSLSSSSSNNFLTPNEYQESSTSPRDTTESSGESSLSSSTSSSSLNGSSPPVKLVPFRGHSVAAFDIDGKEMICLPQVYEIFLKNMVGGLHTVYTKLKRLYINPMVCNVEQTQDFEKLYDDCTSTCTRPGRPSKRNFEDWSGTTVIIKKDKPDSEPVNSSGPVFNQLMQPQMTPQQILMQHFVALTQKNNTFDGGEDDEHNQRSCDDGTPLNLSKSSGNSENDSDSLENMRKEDSSPNNSDSDRGGSNSNSLSMSMEGGSSSSGKNEDGNMMNKVLSLIEIASQQFKHEREELWKERNEIQILRESFHKIVQEERDLRKKLDSQTKKCAAFEKRYKYVNRQLLLVNAELRRYKEKDDHSSNGSGQPTN
ncbi:CRE-DAC-1 protein [Caenorhabditis remanei]|uniref:CRE-DAC-1 protein n=1 Tax=Caenorhabditis remanei TaxID=31234 RepID=E3ML79_CAERE|nr:CRE-DAC-1 protein [Caenorhabditis remanei]